MAKEKEAIVDLSTDNIEDIIKNGAVITPEIAEAAAKRVADLRQEKLTQELISIVNKADYTHKRILLTMKKTKKESTIKTNYLKDYTALVTKLKSGDKSLSIPEFNKQALTARDTCSKAMKENDTWYEETVAALEEQYPEARHSWRYENMIPKSYVL